MALPETTTTEQLELSIDGMTCALCVTRIEGRLNKLDGVAATVNYATEKARVEYGADRRARAADRRRRVRRLQREAALARGAAAD